MTQLERNPGGKRERSVSSEFGTSDRLAGDNDSGPDNNSGARYRGLTAVGSPQPEVFPLTAAQRGIWFAQHLTGSSPISVAQYVEIIGELFPELLIEACRIAGREFGSGHLRLTEIDGEPRQFVDHDFDSPVIEVDLRGHADPVATAHRLMVQDYSAPLDMSHDRLMTSVIYQVGVDHYLWYQRAHHIALDGYAAVTMLRRITQLYNAWIEGHEAPQTTAQDLREITAQDVAYRDSERFDNDRRYWTEHLAGAPPVVSLAGRIGRPTIHPVLVSRSLPERTARLLDEVVLERGSSVTPVVVAAFAAYLGRMTGSDEVLLSLPVSGRHSAILRRSGGMVANVVPLRLQVTPRTAGELIEAAQSELTSALRRQRYRQEDIFRDMGIARDETASFGPAVNLMMIENEAVFGETIGRLNVLTSGPTADLFVNIYPGAGAETTHIDFQGNPEIYSADELAGHHRRFLMFLHEFLAGGADCPIGRLPLLEEPERAELLPVRGPAEVAPRLLPDILTEGARRAPAGAAIVSAGQTMTYAELDTRSSRLARRLIALGCGPDDAVAILIRRSTESIVAAWAIAKCGAAIVQVDPEYPPKRIEHMITDSGARVAFTLDEYLPRLPEQVRPVLLDDPAMPRECDDLSDEPITDAERTRPLRPENLAYLTYTSGSTGVPKGVYVTHTGLANLIADRTEIYGIDTNSRVSYALSPSFDASMEQFLTCFANGATLVVVPPTVIGGEMLTGLLAATGVTHLTLTPAMLATVDPEPLTAVRVVVVGGDVCPPHVVDRWSRTTAMFNEYGPTETTVTAAGAAIRPGRGLTVGAPIRGVAAMVLGRTLQPVPKGTAGELYLAGPGMARGYSHLLPETAARFVADPYGAAGDRMYRTGDLARWVGGDGADSELALELMGRSDFQIKIRGYRIEPGEIDAALTGHEDVDLSVTVPAHNQAGATVLVSYVVPVRDRRLDSVDIARYARESLPPHMVPALIMTLDSLPTNAFGKLDRAALPAPEFGGTPAGRAPATPRESLVAGLFGEVLGVRQVGADDSFFALGGDSILSIQLVARAKAVGLNFSTQDVFDQKTVAALAATATTSAAGPQLPELPGGGVGAMPLSPIVQAMLERGNFDRFAQAALVTLPDGVKRADLVRAVQALLDHHDMLRAVLRGAESVDGFIDVQEPGSVAADAVLTEVGLARRDAAEVDGHLQAAADRLDPANGVLVQAVRLTDDRERGPDLLWLVIHHLAIDAVSWRILLADLGQAWCQVDEGGEPRVGAPATSMRRWLHGLVEQAPGRCAAELEWWKDVLAPGDRLLGARRLDPRRDVGATAGTVRTRVPAEVTEAVLTTVAARFHGGANDPLLTALVLALSAWRRARGTSVAGELISLEGHGREEQAVPGADLGATVGWFTTRFPIRLDLRGIDLDEAFAGGSAAGLAIKQVKEQLRAVPDNGIGFGMVRRLDAKGAAELARAPEPQISFNYLGRVGARDHSGAWAPTSEFDALTATTDPRMALPAVVDVNAIAEEGPDGLELEATWEFAAQILDAAEVEELAGLWVDALRALAEHVRSDSAGGFTPSDFPLVEVTSADIDGWQRDYRSMTDVWPLTALQSGLLFHAIYDTEGADGYTVQAALKFTGEVDEDRMRRAAQLLLDRHDSLRTAFVESPSGPRQIVSRDVEVDWQTFDLTAVADGAARETRLRALAAEAAAPFDPARPPLLRFHLLHTGAEEYQLLVTNHHIMLDGWSMPLLIHELLTAYRTAGDVNALGPARSYRDYLQWMSAQDHDTATAAWRRMLDGVESPTRVTGRTDRVVSARNGDVGLRLDTATSAAVLALGRSHGITANTAVQAAWALLLTVLTGRSDVVFGNTVSHRPPQLAGVERMVGLFINTLPVRVRLDPGETIGDLLARMQSEQAAMLDHRHIGLAELQRVTGVADMFDTVTVLESYPLDQRELAGDLSGAGLRLVEVDAHDATPYPLSLQVTPPRPMRAGSALGEPDTHTVTLRFSTDRFDVDEARSLLERFELILTQLATDPTATIAQLRTCWDSERAELLSVGTEARPTERTLRDILADTVRAHPDDAAVRAGDTVLTYRELDDRAARLAAVLAARGAHPESFVALALPRSIELIVAIWAVARTGAAFVPLDPAHPAERTAELLADSHSTLGITVGAVAQRLQDTLDWVVLDDAAAPDRSAPTQRDGTAPEPAAHGLRADSTAYVIYTSGSTGKPKAVQVTHRGLACLVAAQSESFEVNPLSTVLHVASPGFDACVSELLLAHSAGACLVVAAPEAYAGPDLEQLLREQRVSHAVITPSVLGTLDPARLPELTTIAVVGEATGPDTVDRWARGRRLMNHYGPTEATIWATGSNALRPGEPVTIGAPIPGVSAAVLDHWLRPVPVGVTGELYLGGPGLARGYYDRPDLTAARFVADPIAGNGERLYRTGDAVRWVRGQAGPELEYLGRNDEQVKIHGLRIEPEEIDAHLTRHEAIASAATIARPGPAGEPVLVSYIVPVADAVLDIRALHDDLATELPHYMNPAAIVALEAMPLSTSGKIARDVLRRRDFQAEVVPGRAVSTPAEHTMARLFAEVLHLDLDSVSAQSNFFTLGGDSIVSMRLVALAKAAGLVITPRDVFDAKTVAGLAATARTATGAATAESDRRPARRDDGHARPTDFPLVRLTESDIARLTGRYGAVADVWPLSPMQSGIHFHSMYDPDTGDNYTVQTMIAFSGDIDAERLRRAAQALVDRHDILRAAYAETAAGPCQIVLDHAEVAFGEVRLDSSEGAQAHAEAETIAAADAARGFDLSQPPLIRFTVIGVGPGDWRLLVTNHHVILDGWSMPLLLGELLEYYGSPDLIGAAGPAPSYRDYLVWLADQDRAGAEAAWAHEYATVDSPTRVARGTGRQAGAAAAEVEAELSAGRYERLRRVAADTAVTVNAAIAAAWALNLRVLTGETEVIFGSAVSGRPPELPMVDQALGMYLNTIPLRVQLDPTASLRDLLTDIQATHARMLDHHYIGLPEIQRSAGVSELFDTAIAFQSFPVDRPALQQLVDSAGLRVEDITGLDATPFPLSLVVAPVYAEDGTPALRATLRFLEHDFDSAQARRILDHFVESLDRIAATPGERLGDLALTDEPGVARPEPAAERVAPRTLAALLADSASTAPEAIAVSCGEQTMTYRQLDERSDRLARVLLDRGIAPGTVVACVLPRSLAATVTLWAVAKTGASFLPIDPKLPAERIEFLVGDSGARVAVSDTASADRLPGNLDRLLVDDERTARAIETMPSGPITDAERGGPVPIEATAYVIYTSGSTGIPKGVLVGGRGLAELVAAQRRILGVDRDSAVLHVASPSFDASVFELLMAHGSRGRLVISPPDVYGGPELAQLIRREQVSHAVLTPSALATLPVDGVDELRVLATAGEALGPELVQRWARDRTMINLYGPSESTIWATACTALRPGMPITIGGPVGPVATAVLDTWLRPVPEGVAGELYLFGVGLADGYIGKPELSAARFVACPFGEPGRRMYRTGDMVRRTATGDLEFLGRNDFQVKVRGTRVELGEIDAALGARTEIAWAVTVPRASAGRPVLLVSYVVPVEGTRVSGDDLREALTRSLPAYMVPAAVIVLDEVPLTANGKLDRDRLPEPEFATREFRAPSSWAEGVVAAAFEDVLEVDRVGVDDDFFVLGGDSLSASLVAARVGAALDVRVPVRAVFEAPTVGALAELARGFGGRGRVALTSGVRPEVVPLSLAQQRMWFLNRFEPESAAYNIPVVLRLSGRLDIEALQTALRDVVDRHEVLRTVYPEMAGEPHQMILDDPESLLTGSAPASAEAVADSVGEFIRAGFDVTSRVPMRVGLFEIDDAEHPAGEGEYLLVMVVHHIAGDGQSMGPLARDVMIAYTARVAGHAPVWEPLPVQYADYALWQRQMLGTSDDPESLLSEQLQFWRSTLEGAPDQLLLPADRPRPAVASLAGGRVPIRIEPQVHHRLVELAHGQGASLFMVVHTALAVLLGRLSDTDDVVIGSPIAGRGEPGLADLVGMFVNTLVLRTQVEAGESFTELLRRTRDADLRAFEHADVPFERVVEELNPDRSTSQHPLFQVALAFQNLSDVEIALPEVVVSRADADTGVSQFDLQLVISDEYGESGEAQGVSGQLMFARDLFDESTVAGFADRLIRLLTAIAADPATPVGDIDWLAEGEHAELVSRVGARPGIELPATLPELFAVAVGANRDGVAVVAGETEVTYAELDERSNRLARVLIAHGAGPEIPVLAAVARSVESVLVWWAVVKSGAVYVPIDPAYPAARIETMIAESGATLGITVSEARAELPDAVDWIVFDEPEVAARIEAEPATAVGDDERTRPLRPENVAYVVFTSGSTGVPKGVAVTHTGMADFHSGPRSDPGLGTDARVLHFASPSFDGSLLEILTAVGAAATVVIAPIGTYGGGELAEVLRTRRVTHAFITPAALSSVDPDGLDDLRLVMSGGEQVPEDLVKRWAGTDRAGRREFRVLYGPTETTMITTAARWVRPGDRPTIGTPLPGIHALVLDARLRPVPAGVAGELYLAGPAPARGYLNNQAVTAARFVTCPYGEPGARMYRTGDLVRWTDDGRLAFIGRNDFQVKIRGFRVELGEIDALLDARADISFAATVPRRDGAGPMMLVSYVVPADGAQVTGPELSAALAEVLPSYMVPAAVMVLDKLPLSPNGKVDRRALPAPVFQARGFRAPESPVEEIVAAVFADVLDIDRAVGADDDFFELGGNSLVATRVAARVGAALDTTVRVQMIFESPTVARLAARVESHADVGRVALTEQHRPERIPLSYAQQRMWFLNRFEPESPAYSIPIVMRVHGRLDLDALQAAVGDVVARHEVLRTVYPNPDGEPVQVVLPAAEAAPSIPVVRIAESEVTEAVSAFVSQVFDVTTEVPFRLRLFAVGHDEWVLAAVMHHITGDGSSLRPLAQDVMIAYTARTQGEVPAWPPLPVQYADYAIWQHTVLGTEDDPDSLLSAQIDYWKAQLADLPPVLELPIDRPRPPVQSYAGTTVPFTVDAALHADLQRVASAHNATLFMVFHTALAAALARLSATDDVTIGTPYAGRGEPELDDLIGMFVNTLVLRTRVRPGMSFTDLLEQVRAADLAAFGHADVPFERLVQELNPVRSHAHHPLFQVMLAFQNLGSADFVLPDLSVAAVEADTGLSLFDLQVTVSDTYDATGAPAGLDGGISYATDLFEPDTVTAVIDRLQRLLRALAADPARALHDVDLLDPEEREVVLKRWNSNHRAFGEETMASMFADAMRTHADRIAVVSGAQSLSYAELASRVNRLARWLIARGVGPESLVAVRMPRCLDQLVATYAVIAAGGGYVPIDPDYPADRIDYILETAEPTVVLSTLDGVDLSGFDDAPITDSDRITALRPDNIACVLFTSGSTGRPKGVAVAHRAVMNQLYWIITTYDITPEDTVLHKTPATFDVSVWELFGTLGAGARLVIARSDGHADPDYLAEAIAAHRVTLTSFVPSMLMAFAGAAPAASLRSLRAVLVGGEAFGADVVAAARKVLPGAQLHNLYGPTEFTLHATARPLRADDDAAIPIGAPVWNVRAYVLDSRLRPVPLGVAGELYLAGTQAARGYQARPGLTASRFVPDPFTEGGRLYRTGDLARWRRGGGLEYLGRTDFQVKLRGLRIELGEVESVLAEHPSVARAAAAVHGEGIAAQLIAYLVPAEGVTVDVAAVRTHAATRLAEYMVPSTMLVLDTVPFTASGKLDRNALPDPDFTAREFREPSTWLEGEVARAFENVLGVQPVGADDDFYALGGNSLRSVQVVTELKKGLHYAVPVSWMLSDPRPADLAKRIESGMRSGTEVTADTGPGFDVLLPIRTSGALAPLFCVHPASGLAWCYRPLDEYLTADRPIYGLQAPQLGGEIPGPTTIEDIAARYYAEIRTVQPHGPYHLLGWSLGGQIAHAIAAEMRAAGEQVALLALLDAEADGFDASMVTTVTTGDLVSNLGPVLGIDFVDADASAEEAAELIREHLGDGLGVDAAMLERMTDAYNMSIRAAVDWHPRVVDADMVYFTATENRRADARGHLGWVQVVDGEIANVEVAVEHLGMTEPAALARVCAILDEWHG